MSPTVRDDAAELARALGRALDDGVEPAEVTGLLQRIDALFTAHHGVVYATCVRAIGDPEQALEIAQDALLRAYQKLPEFRGDAAFRTWLIGIARYECINAVRKRRDLLTDDGVIEAEDPAGSALAAMRRTEREDLLRDAAAAVLDPTEQELIHLRYVEHLPIERITALLGITEASGARGALQRCRRKLGRELRSRLDALGHGSSFLRDSG